MKPKIALLSLSCLLAAAAGQTAEPAQLNLLPDGSFQPVRMNGEITAIRGWELVDRCRMQYGSKYRTYLSGEGLFTLTEEENAVKITFASPLHEAYTEFKKPFSLESPFGIVLPPAPNFRFTGRVKFNAGRVEFTNGLKLSPAADWQTIDFKGRFPSRIYIYPAAGASFQFADFKVTAEYPQTGTIALPDGGTLSKIIVSKNPDFKEVRGASMWRGWLWKLTGQALPVEAAEKVEPTPGALTLLEDRQMAESWRITVDKNGIVLKCRDLFSAVPALFDYLRRELKYTELCSYYTFYGLPAVSGPKPKSVKELVGCDRKVKQKFGFVSTEDYGLLSNGGLHRSQFAANAMVDWFHYPSPSPYHILNAVLPMERYYKTHPEYFMLDASGKRVISENPGLNHPCLSNPEVRKIIVDNLVEYANAQLPDHRQVAFHSGDSSENCHCKKCSSMDVSQMFNELLATASERFRDGKFLLRSAYSSRRTAPKGRPANMTYHYCLDMGANPCTLHVDCPLNQPMFEEIREWRKAAGSDEFLGFSTYRDRRPLFHLKQLQALSKYGCHSLHAFVWHGYSPATPFVTGRWNMGEDAEKLVEEFDHTYFGKGGDAMHKITLLVEDFAANYKHTPEELKSIGSRHICIFGGMPSSQTVLDRPTFDRIYALFDEALKAEQDPEIRARIELEKVRYLLEDLNKYNRLSCKNKQELADFTRRLGELIRIARTNRKKLEPLWIGVSGRNYIMNVAGVAVANTGKAWWQEAEIDKIVNHPDEVFAAGEERIPGGWYFRPNALQGKTFAKEYSWQCPPRIALSLTRPSLGKSSAAAVLNLDRAINAPSLLSIEGLDDDKPGASLIRVAVNGTTIYEGEDRFPEKEWGRMGFTVPRGLLKAGRNEITVSNVTPDTPSRSARFTKAGDGAGDPQWGWFMISELSLHDPSGDFKDLADGKSGTFWHQINQKPLGKIKSGNGKVEFIGNPEAKHTGIVFSNSLIYPKPAKLATDSVRVRVKASGSGKLVLGCYGYTYARAKNGSQIIPVLGYGKRWDRWGWGGYAGYLYDLSEEEKTYSMTFAKVGNSTAIAPLVAVQGGGRAVISEVEIEIVPAKK